MATLWSHLSFRTRFMDDFIETLIIKNGSVSRGYYSTLSYIPFLISIICSLIFAFLTVKIYDEEETKITSTAKSARTELFIYGLIVSVITIISCFSNILKVKVSGDGVSDILNLNGWKVFNTYNSLGGGFQLIAFILFTALTVMLVLLGASIMGYLSKSKFFYKITVIEIISATVFVTLIGLFGKYYEIVQKINRETVGSWIAKSLDIPVSDVIGKTSEISYKVTSTSFVFFIIVAVIVAVILFRKPYTRALTSSAWDRQQAPIKNNIPAMAAPQQPIADEAVIAEPCPAFAEIDNKQPQVKAQNDIIKNYYLDAPSLPKMVRFIVDYARNSRLHLSYTQEDIATFIAGLGATKLTILQGMSGTGKTSLPKIFSEAIFGNCDIIEIESSWRDKNELLGYYNEFSHVYTPKKFTQALYSARLNPERITFIVLDEMNLSRIEYYFSDFLSLMENEEDKREIKLLNVGLYRTINDGTYKYMGLENGHTIKIPSNVWFIGTANRDESTFEISDKVYDRAHTMNFNKRAPKVTTFGEAIPQKYISAQIFAYMLEEAKKNTVFDVSSSAIIKEVEELLAPYNISFGNRVANQMEAFVSIYCACFEPSETVKHDAIEKILLSKVVSKLEYKSVENKEYLAAEFKKRNLLRCSEFILKLNED